MPTASSDHEGRPSRGGLLQVDARLPGPLLAGLQQAHALEVVPGVALRGHRLHRDGLLAKGLRGPREHLQPPEVGVHPQHAGLPRLRIDDPGLQLPAATCRGRGLELVVPVRGLLPGAADGLAAVECVAWQLLDGHRGAGGDHVALQVRVVGHLDVVPVGAGVELHDGLGDVGHRKVRVPRAVEGQCRAVAAVVGPGLEGQAARVQGVGQLDGEREGVARVLAVEVVGQRQDRSGVCDGLLEHTHLLVVQVAVEGLPSIGGAVLIAVEVVGAAARQAVGTVLDAVGIRDEHVALPPGVRTDVGGVALAAQQDVP
mmetsp:Transcript_15559/g.48980  ORF Transcript_15559/g.48980 Transcript_15559/m.48980 type:complete len:314 (+) Transcript_15559:86-1027(+)